MYAYPTQAVRTPIRVDRHVRISSRKFLTSASEPEYSQFGRSCQQTSGDIDVYRGSLLRTTATRTHKGQFPSERPVGRRIETFYQEVSERW